MTTSTSFFSTPEKQKQWEEMAERVKANSIRDELRLRDVEKRLKILEKQFSKSKKN